MADAPYINLEAKREHDLLLNKLHDKIGEEKTKAMRQLFQSKLKQDLDTSDVRTMLNALTDKNVIQVGKYTYLKQALSDIHLERLVDIVEEKEKSIKFLLRSNTTEDTVHDESQEQGEGPEQSCQDTAEPSSQKRSGVQHKVKLKQQKSEINKQATELILRKADEGLTMEFLREHELLLLGEELVAPLNRRQDSARRSLGKEKSKSKSGLGSSGARGPFKRALGFRKQFHRLCVSETIPVYRQRVAIVGPYGVGKTHLAKRLLQEEYDEEKDANIFGVKIYRHRCIVHKSDRSCWVRGKAPPPGDSGSDDFLERATEKINIMNIDPGLVEKIEAMARGEIADPEKQITIWDFAGQDVYYTMHQSFLSDQNIYLLVFRLDVDLDEIIPVHRGEKSVKELIVFWLNAIHMHKIRKWKEEDKNVCPCVLVIGTHEDKLLTQDSDRILCELREYLDDKQILKEHIFDYFAISNLANEKKFDGIKVAIEELCGYTSDCEASLSWIQLERNLAKKSEEKPIISMNELCEMAQIVGLSDRELQEKYIPEHHRQGDILHFKVDGLENIVIIDPLWLADLFSAIMNPVNIKSRGSNLGLQRGVLKEEVFDEYLQEIKMAKIKASMIRLMLHFDLMLEISQSIESPLPYPGKRTFVVPSLLVPSDSANSALSETDPTKYLLVSFPNVVFHPGLFHRLIIRLLRKYRAQTYEKNIPVVGFDRASFRLEDDRSLLYLVIEDKDMKMMITNASPSPTGPHIYSKARQTVVDELAILLKIYCPGLQSGYCIRERNDGPNIPIEADAVNTNDFVCKYVENSEKSIDLRPYRVWFSAVAKVPHEPQSLGEVSSPNLIERTSFVQDEDAVESGEPGTEYETETEDCQEDIPRAVKLYLNKCPDVRSYWYDSEKGIAHVNVLYSKKNEVERQLSSYKAPLNFEINELPHGQDCSITFQGKGYTRVSAPKAGTMGGYVYYNGKYYGITCNHCLDQPPYVCSVEDLDVHQKMFTSYGKVYLSTLGYWPESYDENFEVPYYIDAACVEIEGQAPAQSRMIPYTMDELASMTFSPGLEVQKYGSGSEKTFGKLLNPVFVTKTHIPNKNCEMAVKFMIFTADNSQLSAQPSSPTTFSVCGDSGSIITTADQVQTQRKPLAMLIGEFKEHAMASASTIAVPLSVVLDWIAVKTECDRTQMQLLVMTDE